MQRKDLVLEELDLDLYRDFASHKLRDLEQLTLF